MEIFSDWRAWLIVTFLALITLISSTAKYEVGKKGLPKVKEKFPQVSEERWGWIHGQFSRWGSPVVLISLIPGMAWLVPPAAGAFGIRLGPFLLFTFIAKFFRYWILLFLFYGGFQLFK